MARLRLSICAFMILTLSLTGCTWDLFRRTSEKKEFEAPPKLPELKNVGHFATVVGVEPIKVFGVGVVQGLRNTGSNPPPSSMRQQALRELKAMGVSEPVEFLGSPSTALVIVSAVIPPGARKGDRIDVEVELTPEDKATSLRGGELIYCSLHEYGDVNALRGRSSDGQRMVAHQKLVKAEGPILIGGIDAEELHRRGRVWAGGSVLKERGFDLAMNKNNQSAALAMAIAKNVNDRFHTSAVSGQRVVAEALNPTRVTLRLPEQYRLNWPRYLRLLQVMPLDDSPAVRRALAEQLGRELYDPNQAINAALQLEALGHGSISYLKQGLRADHPLSRFCSAEALAYLGDPACAEPLAELVRSQPEFRAYGLTALASLNEAVCHLKLRELMQETSPETRYGAFKALRMLNENDPMVRGEKLAGGFHLHRVSCPTATLVHVCTGGRAEVVIFGNEPQLQPPFSFRAGEDFVVTAREGDSECLVSRISLHLGRDQRNCSLKLADVVATLGEMQASYTDVVGFLTRADECRSFQGTFAIDALPNARPLELVRQEETGEFTDLGDTPNLFSRVGRIFSRDEPK